MDEDFIIFKVDMRNPFNTLSRQVLPDECAKCHGYRGVMGTIHVVAPSRRNPFRITSTGDLLGPLLFSLVLQKLVSHIDANNDCKRYISIAYTGNFIMHALGPFSRNDPIYRSTFFFSPKSRGGSHSHIISVTERYPQTFNNI